MFVTVAYAQSINGAIASTPRLLISSPESFLMTHELRSIHDAILVGSSTIKMDNPLLNIRPIQTTVLTPVILNSNLSIDPLSRIFSIPDRRVIIFYHSAASDRIGLFDNIATLMPINLNNDGFLDLNIVLSKLEEVGIKRVMVEGGATIIGQFLKDNLVDAVNVTISPRFIPGVCCNILKETVLVDASVEALGSDFILKGRVLRS